MGFLSKKIYNGMGGIIGFHPKNLNTLYLLCLFYFDKAEEQSALSLVGAKVLELAFPCLDSAGFHQQIIFIFFNTYVRMPPNTIQP